jgi:hypothetical protein
MALVAIEFSRLVLLEKLRISLYTLELGQKELD